MVFCIDFLCIYIKDLDRSLDISTEDISADLLLRKCKERFVKYNEKPVLMISKKVPRIAINIICCCKDFSEMLNCLKINWVLLPGLFAVNPLIVKDPSIPNNITPNRSRKERKI